MSSLTILSPDSPCWQDWTLRTSLAKLTIMDNGTMGTKQLEMISGHRKEFPRSRIQNIPNNVVNATYCIFCRWIGISFPMSWWIIGKNGGQFLSSITIPAVKTKQRTLSYIKYNHAQPRWLQKKENQYDNIPRAIASSFRFSSWKTKGKWISNYFYKHTRT